MKNYENICQQNTTKKSPYYPVEDLKIFFKYLHFVQQKSQFNI